jgi:hypothetical protein
MLCRTFWIRNATLADGQTVLILKPETGPKPLEKGGDRV